MKGSFFSGYFFPVRRNFILITLAVVSKVFSQEPDINSLRRVIASAGQDTARFNALMELGSHFQQKQNDTALKYHLRAKELASKMRNAVAELDAERACIADSFNITKKGGHFAKFSSVLKRTEELIASPLTDVRDIEELKRIKSSLFTHIGSVYYYNADYVNALKYFTSAYNLFSELQNKKQVALNAGNIGTVNSRMGNYSEALKYLFVALKIEEELKNRKGVGRHLQNIGGVYLNERQYDKALEYLRRSLITNQEVGNKANVAVTLGNIGSAYQAMSQFEEALRYYRKAIAVDSSLNNIAGVARHYGNVGSIYRDKKDFANAILYLERAINLEDRSGIKTNVGYQLGTLGSIYLDIKDYSKAEKFLKRGLEASENSRTKEWMRFINLELSELYEATNRTALAFQHYKAYAALKDSIFNEDNTRKSVQQELMFEFSRKAVADSTKAAEEKKVIAAQLKSEETQRNALYGGLALVLLFALVMVNRFRVIKRQKNVIALQKEEVEIQKRLVEEQQKSVMDSIRYAKRIQTALITSEKYIQKSLRKLMGPDTGRGNKE